VPSLPAPTGAQRAEHDVHVNNGNAQSALFVGVHAGQSDGVAFDLPDAQRVFLQGCGLWSSAGTSLAWAGQPCWHVLETGFGLGLNFLATWHAWRCDPRRPKHFFYTAIDGSPQAAKDLLQNTSPWPEMHDLALALAAQWRGLMPGMHRIALAQNHVHLTLCIGGIQPSLQELDSPAHRFFLNGFSPPAQSETWPLPALKALARLASMGSRLTAINPHPGVRKDLTQCGFVVEDVAGLPAKDPPLQAVYQPAWSPKSRLRSAAMGIHPTQSVLILGAGLAGSAAAFSLAKRGLAVTVLDAGAGLGAGASGLPVGLTAPHVSPDDNVLSRISRAGVRATLQRCKLLLQDNSDWSATGVLEHRVEGKRALPSEDRWASAGHAWSTPATSEQKHQAGLSEGQAALWHPMAAWLKPRRLVAAQLQHPNIHLQWACEAAQLRWQDGHWQALDASGKVMAQAVNVVLATAYASKSLLSGLLGDQGPHIPFNPLRGQVSMGKLADLPVAVRQVMPTVPVNGHGSFISGMDMPEAFGSEAAWCLGSTFEREATHALIRPEDHASNHARLAKLLPHLAQPMLPAFDAKQVMAWAGVRCTLPDRLPAVGALDEERWPGLWLSAGFGARGLSLSVLAGEWLSAQLCGEPSPLPLSLSKHWQAQRFFKVKS
jgi:tRNA 5-methylaminomethyl-2-thiouridine biosynthesis bifunctional protein